MAASYLVPTTASALGAEQLAATDGGTAFANQIPALDQNGRLTAAMMPAGFGADADTLPASENIVAGAYVNIFNNAGVPSIRNAVASAVGFKAHGYVLAPVASGANAPVMFDDNNTAVTGRTVGDQYLSATVPGQTTSTPPTGAGVIRQFLGVAVSATIIHSSITAPLILAQ
jgi:hypothetical protein